MSTETIAELREWLSYDPDTGVFLWRKYRRNIRAGSVAGGLDKSNGYIVIGFKKRLYYAHRLALAFSTGELPLMVDHINGNKTDNRLSNLRPASNQTNQCNRKPSQGRLSQYKGVSASRSRWRAYLGSKHLGVFQTEEDAARAYDRAALAAYGDFARVNFPPSGGLNA